MRKELRKINDFVWEVPKTFRPGMEVGVKVIASEKLLEAMEREVFSQIINVASMPGIEAGILLPDGHVGFGMPIGGVAVWPLEKALISPGATGFDINCGVRLLVSDLRDTDVLPKMGQVVSRIFREVPSGVGQKGTLRLKERDLEKVLEEGARWAVKQGWGLREDLERMEDEGCLRPVEVRAVSERARERGRKQLGTLGSGNHYLEMQKVREIYDKETALRWGIKDIGQVSVMVHCGSRGLGHQVASEYMRSFGGLMGKYGVEVSDKQLAALPFESGEGRAYFGAMNGAANFAYANREIITRRVRDVFQRVFGKEGKLGLVWDVCHNVAKIEKSKIFLIHQKGATGPVARQPHAYPTPLTSGGPPRGAPRLAPPVAETGTDGVTRWSDSASPENQKRLESGKKFLIHRKGATRSWPGEPVILGGSMESASYLLMGTEKAIEESYGSTAHGAGRLMSRKAALRKFDGRKIVENLKKQGIMIKSGSLRGLAEEAGGAYKDIDEVVRVIDGLGISRKVAKFVAMGNVKG